MNTGVPRNNLVPPPAVFASNSPFVLKDPNPLTAFQPSAVPPVAFQFGFPQGSFFSQSVPVSGATSIQPDQKIPIPSAIQAKTERHSVELQSTATSVSTANARGSHSAPIMSDSQRDEGFHFPVKTELQFYKPKILVSLGIVYRMALCIQVFLLSDIGYCVFWTGFQILRNMKSWFSRNKFHFC